MINQHGSQHGNFHACAGNGDDEGNRAPGGDGPGDDGDDGGAHGGGGPGRHDTGSRWKRRGRREEVMDESELFSLFSGQLVPKSIL